jgi:hypothetical protein
MSLEGLLTYFGLLAAALAIMGPVQRRALALFVPRWLLPISTVLALAFLILRDTPLGIPPPFGWRVDLVTYLLTLGAFVLPVSAAFIAWLLWFDCELSNRNLPQLEAFLQTALREGKFDEVDRVLRRNHDRLALIPSVAATVLFSPRLVQQMVSSQSFVHLELPAHRPILESLQNRLQAVETVVREILMSGVSPVQSAVVEKYGGIEHLQYTSSERALIAATFKNPHWYHDTNAHYPLIITAINKIESGELDALYNQPDENYVATQGVSKRATCPVYLAIKTEVIAIGSAVDEGVEDDFYISDLWQILMKIHSHSKYDAALAKGGLYAPHTPYTYLMNEIASDFEALTERAVQMSVRRNQGTPEDSKPSMTGATLVKMWCLSIWKLMSEPNRINPDHLDQIVERYFRFMFALGWETSEVLCNVGQSVPSLDAWRDIFLEELKGLRQNSQTRALHGSPPSLQYSGPGKTILSGTATNGCKPNSTPTFFHNHEPTHWDRAGWSGWRSCAKGRVRTRDHGGVRPAGEFGSLSHPVLRHYQPASLQMRARSSAGSRIRSMRRIGCALAGAPSVPEHSRAGVAQGSLSALRLFCCLRLIHRKPQG